MTKPRLLLDCDGILSDFITPALAIVASLGDYIVPDTELLKIEHVLPEDARAEYMRRVCARGYCSSLLPYAGAQDAVRELNELAEVVIVTASMGPCPTWAWERTAWLGEHFDIPPSRVVHASSKQFVRGDVFVDDHPKHVEAWTVEHPLGVGLIYDRPYNRGALLAHRALGLADVIAVVKSWAGAR